jgi:hypothetical protein
MKLLKWITSLFTSIKRSNYSQWHVEAFVASKRPNTTAEVEYWIRHYEQQQKNGWAL